MFAFALFACSQGVSDPPVDSGSDTAALADTAGDTGDSADRARRGGETPPPLTRVDAAWQDAVG